MKRQFISPGMAAAIPLLAGTCSLALLAGAHAFERFGGFAPCPLCLDQRRVHWGALGLAILVTVVRRWYPQKHVAFGASASLTAVYGFGTGLALYHAGIEWSWWPGPASCSGGTLIPVAGDLLAGLDGATGGASCTQAVWRLWGLSMAGYNAALSAGLTGLTGYYAHMLSKPADHPYTPLKGRRDAR